MNKNHLLIFTSEIENKNLTQFEFTEGIYLIKPCKAMKLDEKTYTTKKNGKCYGFGKISWGKKSTTLLYNVFLGSRFAWRLLQKNKNYTKLIALAINYSLFPINIYLESRYFPLYVLVFINSNDVFVICICTVKTWFKKDLNLQKHLPKWHFLWM